MARQGGYRGLEVKRRLDLRQMRASHWPLAWLRPSPELSMPAQPSLFAVCAVSGAIAWAASGSTVLSGLAETSIGRSTLMSAVIRLSGRSILFLGESAQRIVVYGGPRPAGPADPPYSGQEALTGQTIETYRGILAIAQMEAGLSPTIVASSH